MTGYSTAAIDTIKSNVISSPKPKEMLSAVALRLVGSDNLTTLQKLNNFFQQSCFISGIAESCNIITGLSPKIFFESLSSPGLVRS
jgi:hypothetical protein